MSRRQRPVRLPVPRRGDGAQSGESRLSFPVFAPEGSQFTEEAATGMVGQVVTVRLPGTPALQRPVLAAVYESPERIVVTVAVPSSVVMPSGPNRPPNVLQSPPLGEDDDG